jgi:hypothetical protein
VHLLLLLLLDKRPRLACCAWRRLRCEPPFQPWTTSLPLRSLLLLLLLLWVVRDAGDHLEVARPRRR